MSLTSVGMGLPESSIYRRLAEIDWTFATARTRHETHGIHPYPAKFIPQIPRTLIAALHPKNDTVVLDPFCGSGTTLVEAAIAGIPAIGVDLHPLACLISKVKVTPLHKSLSNAAAEALSRSIGSPAEPPPIPALDHWFRPPVQTALAALVESIDQEPDPAVRDALRVALSSIVVRVSNQESDTRYAAIDKDVGTIDVHQQFLKSARVIDRVLRSTWPSLFQSPDVRILNRDVLSITREDIGRRVSLVVTSPPYPNAYEYWLYHKYRMYWLGMDPIAVRALEIGARPHYFKKNPHTPTDFARHMTSVFSLLASVMVRGGHACFQVGDSVIRGQVIDNTALLCSAAKQLGFCLVASMTRDIPTSRKTFNPSHGRIKEEDVLVFRWNG